MGRLDQLQKAKDVSTQRAEGDRKRQFPANSG